MECSEKLVLQHDGTLQLCIKPPDEKVRVQISQRWDAIAKPLGGLGKMESLIAQIGAIQGTADVNLSRRAVVIMCADNGIVEEKVSQSGFEVTRAVAEEMGKGSSCVGKMAKAARTDTLPVDIGICGNSTPEGLLNRKIRSGTRNFRIEAAMTKEETLRALKTGIELVSLCRQRGYTALATGEMGIGNTTTSSAVAAALLHVRADEVTGRGAGLTDERLRHKRSVITEALEKYELYEADAFTVLQSVGGLDIAGLAGVCIGGALFGMPVVLDGVISLAAALVAERLAPGSREYLIASHQGREPAAGLLLQELCLHPLIHADLALGEGTGAVMLFSLLDMAMQVYGEGRGFDELEIEPYRRQSEEKK